MKLEAEKSSPEGESVCPFCFQWHLAQIPVRFFWAQSPARSSAKTSKCPHHTHTFPRHINKGKVSISDLCPDLELKKAHLPSLPLEFQGLGTVHPDKSWVDFWAATHPTHNHSGYSKSYSRDTEPYPTVLPTPPAMATRQKPGNADSQETEATHSPDEDSDPSPGRSKATHSQDIRLRGSIRLKQLDHDIAKSSTLTS